MEQIVINHWNNNYYKVVKIDGNSVTLEREDKSQFTISIKEYNYNYREVY